MFGILAIVAFLLCAFGMAMLGPIGLLALGLALLASHAVFPWSPWPRHPAA